LLVLWEIADSHQILQHTLQRLAVGVGASDASMPPSVIKCPPRRSTSPTTIDQSIGTVLNDTMDTFAEKLANANRETQRELVNANRETQREDHIFREKTRINARISQLTDQIRATKKEKFRSKNEEEKSFLDEEIISLEKEIESMNVALRECNRNEYSNQS
jgi:hypothetical protein